MPTSAKVVIGVCLLTVILIPAVKQTGWLKRRVAERPLADVRPPDLVLGETRFVTQSRSIKGVVVNNSGTAYKDVVVSYDLRDARGIGLGTVLATVSKLGPHEKTAFDTGPIPKNAVNYDLREIVGSPR